MAGESNTRPLSIALVVFGLIFLFGIYPLTIVWPSGWNWGPGGEHYLQMIIGIYAVLGIFLLMAAKNPLASLSLIWFTVWSSAAHGAIMAYQAYADPTRHGHLVGDVAALFLVAIVLAVLTPRRPAAAG
jgi:Family of unknown function (DUF6632)